MDPHLCVGIDVGYRSHRVGIAQPDGTILDEFDISHDQAGFGEFFRRVEEHKKRLHYISKRMDSRLSLKEWLSQSDIPVERRARLFPEGHPPRCLRK